MKSESPDGRSHHDPEEKENARGGWPEGDGGHTGSRVDECRGRNRDPDGDHETTVDPRDFPTKSGESISQEGHERGHADEKRERVLDERDARVEFRGPGPEFFLAEAAAAGSIGDPAHNEPVHE